MTTPLVVPAEPVVSSGRPVWTYRAVWEMVTGLTFPGLFGSVWIWNVYCATVDVAVTAVGRTT